MLCKNPFKISLFLYIKYILQKFLKIYEINDNNMIPIFLS